MSTNIQFPKLFPLCAALAACVPLFGAAHARAQGSITDIHVYDFDFGTAAHSHFDPIIQLGDTIRWLWDNNNLAPHSTTSAAGQSESWNSGIQSPPFSFEHTFTHPGVFNYYCLLHGFDAGGGNVGGISGHITVVAVPEPATASILLAGLAPLLVIRTRRQRKQIPRPPLQ